MEKAMKIIDRLLDKIQDLEGEVGGLRRLLSESKLKVKEIEKELEEIKEQVQCHSNHTD